MKGYKAVMSTGDVIRIDGDEIGKVMRGVNGKQAVMVKQGLINPSFLVSVVIDKDRMNKKYADGSISEMPPLVNIFQDIKLQIEDKMKLK